MEIIKQGTRLESKLNHYNIIKQYLIEANKGKQRRIDSLQVDLNEKRQKIKKFYMDIRRLK